jgi:glycyl-tRNA synthetase
MANKVSLEKIVALCKRKGFAYQASEIYGGINGVYDFGPLGTLLRQNLKNLWMQDMMAGPQSVVPIEGSILAPSIVWEASGHIENFSDPMVDCLNCKKRYRADEINLEKSCPGCGKKKWTEIRQFQMMFKTNVGALSDSSSIAYLRPETAQAIYINFKNVMSSTRVKIPFGIAQIGKAFRNEITPKQFLFRMREFEQMEMQFFCKKEDADNFFKSWLERRKFFHKNIGLNTEKYRTHPHGPDELAHYAKEAMDIEYEFPFGWKELEGIHNRSDYDLSQHIKFSGKELGVYDDQTKQSYVPHIVECSIGLDRLFLAIMCNAYCEEEVEGNTRVVLKFNPKVAPIKAAFLPLSKKLSEPMQAICNDIKKLGYQVQFDNTGSIGKLYRRQDEAGTPVCFTYDFESEKDQTVTARNRDTLKQERISIEQIPQYLENILK